MKINILGKVLSRLPILIGVALLMIMCGCSTARESEAYKDYMQEYDIQDDVYNLGEEIDDYEIDSRGY